SDAFADNYCFRVVRDKGRKGFVGLFFSPRTHRLAHDITGTMWLEEATGELRLVEFAFTGMPPEVPEEFASGHIEFHRLDDGSWNVSRWYLRSPLYNFKLVYEKYARRSVVTSRVRIV